MPRALIVDPSLPVSGVLRKFLEAVGFEVRVANNLDEAIERIGDRGLDLVFAAANYTFDGESLCGRVKQLFPSLPVVLVYPPEEDNPQFRAEACGADSWLVGPLKRAAVTSCAKSMLRIKALEEKVAKLDVAFFKKLLLMEVKRSRRYRYPISFLLVAVDGFKERVGALPAGERKASVAEVLQVITGCVRDIDMAVPSGDERFLVFLPHTSREGALVVAERLRDELARIQSLPEATASVGVAAHEPGAIRSEVSVGTLMKDATEALRRAQEAGGNRVEASEKRTRDRISLG